MWVSIKKTPLTVGKLERLRKLRYTIAALSASFLLFAVWTLFQFDYLGSYNGYSPKFIHVVGYFISIILGVRYSFKYYVNEDLAPAHLDQIKALTEGLESTPEPVVSQYIAACKQLGRPLLTTEVQQLKWALDDHQYQLDLNHSQRELFSLAEEAELKR